MWGTIDSSGRCYGPETLSEVVMNGSTNGRRGATGQVRGSRGSVSGAQAMVEAAIRAAEERIIQREIASRVQAGRVSFEVLA